ncbi:MAG TPA: hypothetical protein DCE42_29695, partial [Myxococcales bacterium]|nr:hypothetical protein [Myxococcales bacterium]
MPCLCVVSMQLGRCWEPSAERFTGVARLLPGRGWAWCTIPCRAPRVLYGEAVVVTTEVPVPAVRILTVCFAVTIVV